MIRGRISDFAHSNGLRKARQQPLIAVQNPIEFPSPPRTETAMNRLLVLTADRTQGDNDSSFEIHRRDGTTETYLFVDQVQQLAYYRHESVSEEEARQLIG